MDVNTMFAIANLLLFTYSVNTLKDITNHYRRFDNLLLRMVNILEKVGEVLDDTSMTSDESDSESDIEASCETISSASETSSETEASETSSETDPDMDFEEWVMPSGILRNVVWNVCTPFDHAMKVVGHEKVLLDTSDFEQVVIGTTPTSTVNIRVLVGDTYKEFPISTPATAQQVLEGLASFFHDPQNPNDPDSPCLFEKNIITDMHTFTIHSILTFHGLYRVFDEYAVDLREN